jgi:hypothetical protein
MGDTRLVVTELRLGVRCTTRILISEHAKKKLEKFLRKKDPNRILWKTLSRIARDGFANFTGEDRIVRPEGVGVYAIGVQDNLFRLAGFFPIDQHKVTFVITDAYEKPGQKRGPKGDNACKEAARIKRENDWREYVYAPRLVSDAGD